MASICLLATLLMTLPDPLLWRWAAPFPGSLVEFLEPDAPLQMPYLTLPPPHPKSPRATSAVSQQSWSSGRNLILPPLACDFFFFLFKSLLQAFILANVTPGDIHVSLLVKLNVAGKSTSYRARLLGSQSPLATYSMTLGEPPTFSMSQFSHL